MKSYRVVFMLLSGLMLFSCSGEGNATLEDSGTSTEETSNDDEAKVLDEDTMEEMEKASTELSWKTYHNERFNFCVDYPANFLTPQGESENHDGNTFTNANGSSEMRASGIFNALFETVEDAYERATEGDTYYEDERKITYKRQHDNWFVVSGNYYESIFYVRTALVRDTFYTLYYEYHPSEKVQFDAIIDRNSKTFPDCKPMLGSVQ